MITADKVMKLLVKAFCYTVAIDAGLIAVVWAAFRIWGE